MSDNLSPRSVSKRQTQVASYDLNGDGVLDADEYKLLRYDKDGDGQLDQEELALASKEDTQFTFRASGDRRRGKETFLGGGLKIDMMFLNGSDDVPERFLCPITDRPMTEPVIASDGFTYERQSIQGVFDTQRNQCFSPSTGKKMTDFTLKPNDNLLAEIKNWFVEIAKKDEFDTMADIDGDGQVTENEAALWSKRRGDQDDDDYYRGRDRDGDGVVDMDEFFTGMWERIVEGDWVDDPDSVFRLLDKGKVGSVCLDDVKDVLTELADVDHDGVISAEELRLREENIRTWERLFKDFDDDGNNEISMQEFKAAFQRSFIRAGRGMEPPPKQWAKPGETPAWVQDACKSGKGVMNCDRAFN